MITDIALDLNQRLAFDEAYEDKTAREEWLRTRPVVEIMETVVRQAMRRGHSPDHVLHNTCPIANHCDTCEYLLLMKARLLGQRLIEKLPMKETIEKVGGFDLYAKGFDHPCRQTCSGWNQGRLRGEYETRLEYQAALDQGQNELTRYRQVLREIAEGAENAPALAREVLIMHCGPGR